MNNSASRYRQALQTAGIGFACLGTQVNTDGSFLDFQCLEVNSEFIRLTGLNAGDPLCGSDKEISSFLVHNSPFQEWIAIALTSETHRLKIAFDQENRRHELQFVKPETGEIILVVIDKTQLKKLEDGLSTEYKFWNEVIEEIPGIFFMLHQNGQFVLWNHETRNCLGATEEQMAWLSFLSLFRDECKSTIEELIDTAFTEGAANFEATLISLTAAKREIYFYCHRIALLGNHYLIGSGVDISERKQAEFEQRIAAIAFETQEGIMITDADTTILKVNRSFTTVTGYSAEEAIGQTPRLLKSGQQPIDFYVEMWKCIHQTGAWEGEIWNRHKNGHVYPGHLTITSVKDVDHRVSNYVAMLTDITAKKETEEKIKVMAFYDPLTGLANRRLMIDRLSQHLSHALREGGLVIVCMLDLDGFKLVNDQFGHAAGDALLIEVAKRLQKTVRQSDTVSRFGGDEFALILCDIKEICECEHLFKRIISSLAAPYLINGDIAHVTASIGATIFPNDDGETPEILLRHADQAMYEAKEAGKNCYCLFNPSHHLQQISNKAMLEKIRKAMMDGQFVLFYQPQVDCRAGEVVGVEALIRWNHPILGQLAPSEFIPLLEHDNLIINVGEWVINKALKQQVEWKKAGFNLKISVNVASRHLHQDLFVKQLTEMLDDQDLDVINHLTIEIVETAALEDISKVSETIKQCRDLGVNFAIDDFGTGFSSLAHLKHLAVNELKIDKSFVINMLKSPDDLAIVRGVIGLGVSFKHAVIAEGVESIDQILMLMDLGCNIVQGYFIARPMPADKLTSWLKTFEPNPLWKLPFTQASSRHYFELLLAETNHSHWIKQQYEIQTESLDDRPPQEIFAGHQCQFGRWLQGDGGRQFGQQSWFLMIQAIHQHIHDSAIKLCAYQNNGQQEQAHAEAAYLHEQQNLLTESLKNARQHLSDQYLMTH